VVESVKHLKAELQVLTLRDVENLAERHIAGYRARPDKTVLCRITERKLGRLREAVGVKPILDCALTAGQIAVAGLLGAVQAVRAGV